MELRRQRALTWPRTLAGSALPILLSLAFLGAGMAGVAVAKAAPAEPDDDPAALVLLERAVRAAATLSYSGTQLISFRGPAGSGSGTVEVRQDATGTRQLSTGPAVGGPWLRTTGYRLSPALAGPVLAVLAATHRLRLAGTGRVAGRPAVLVSAARGGRLVARLWLDRSTDLLLRLEVLDSAGRPARTAGFLDLRPGVTPARPSSVAAVASGWPQTISGDLLDRLRGQGWPAPDDLPGGFRLLDSRRAGDVLHLTYTDGLSGVSVFLQPGLLEPAGLTGFSARSWGGHRVLVADGQWPLRVVWQDGGGVATLIADAPGDQVEAIIAGFPASTVPAAETGLAGRLRAVLDLLPGR